MAKKMRVFMSLAIVLLGSFFLTSFVSAAGSSSEAEFNILGCTFWDMAAGESIGLAVGECSTGDEYGGMFYCNEDRGGYITTEAGFGCTRGNDFYLPGTALGACCPSERPYCAEDVDTGLFKCQEREATCLSDMEEEECESVQVDGYYYEGTCICSRTEQSCDIYKTETACFADSMDIGATGVGRSEYCGGYLTCNDVDFSIPASSCGCSWNIDTTTCEHSITAEEAFPEDVNVMNKFECTSDYNLGAECIDGSRDYFWDATFTDKSVGETNAPLEECLTILGCNGGSGELSCGETFVKLPGFSLFSLFMSMFLIGIYYFISARFKSQRTRLL